MVVYNIQSEKGYDGLSSLPFDFQLFGLRNNN